MHDFAFKITHQRIVTFCFFFLRLINTLTYLLTYLLKI